MFQGPNKPNLHNEQTLPFFIIHLTDTHGESEELAKLFSQIEATIKNKPGAVLFVTGDVLGTCKLLSTETKQGLDIKIFEHFSKLFEDKMFFVPGNHDFVPSAEVLNRFIQKTNCQTLMSNVSIKKDARIAEHAKEHVVIETNQGKIGILGIVTPESTSSPKWTESLSAIKSLEEYKQQLKEQISTLKKEECQTIIIMSHLGSAQDRLLAEFLLEEKDIPSIPILICGGHTHDKTEKAIHLTKDNKNIFITNAGAYGEGFVSLSINTTESPSIVGEFVDISDQAKPNLVICEHIEEAKEIVRKEDPELLENPRKTIFESKEKIVGAHVRPDITPPSIRVQDSFITQFSIDAIADFASEHLERKIYGLMPAAAIRTEYEPGAVSKEDICGNYFLKNKIQVIEVTGESLITGLANGIFSHPYCYKQRALLLHPSAGLEYSYDLNYEKNIITSVEIEGKYINPEETYLIATTDYIVTKELFPDAEVKATINTKLPIVMEKYSDKFRRPIKEDDTHKLQHLTIYRDNSRRIYPQQSPEEQCEMQSKHLEAGTKPIPFNSVKINIEPHTRRSDQPTGNSIPSLTDLCCKQLCIEWSKRSAAADNSRGAKQSSTSSTASVTDPALI